MKRRRIGSQIGFAAEGRPIRNQANASWIRRGIDGLILAVALVWTCEAGAASTEAADASPAFQTPCELSDTEPPVFSCPSPSPLKNTFGYCGALKTDLVPPPVSDNCSVAVLTNDAPGLLPLGMTRVQWTALDPSGNSATCTQEITVIDDQPPFVTCSTNLEFNADAGNLGKANVTWASPSVSENCSAVTVVCTPPSGSTFPLGVTTVECNASDSAGNKRSCRFTVTVQRLEIDDYREGGEICLTATNGLPPYEWFRDGLLIDGETNATLCLPNLRPGDAGYYSVRGSTGTGVFRPAQPLQPSPLIISNVTEKVRILKHPGSVTTGTNFPVTFRVVASGSEPIFYQWLLNGVKLTNHLAITDAGSLTARSALSGADTDTLVISNALPADAGTYSVVVYNARSSKTSKAAFLVLSNATTLPLTLRDRSPYAMTDSLNGRVAGVIGRSLGRSTTRSNGVSILWRAPAQGVVTFTTAGSAFDTALAVYEDREVATDGDRGGFTTSLLRFNAERDHVYRISTTAESAEGGNVLLSWRMRADACLPVITRQPRGIAIPPGSTATFTVEATNPPCATTLSYQWFFNGTALAGETANVLVVSNDTTCATVGRYWAEVSNEAANGETAESRHASLELYEPGVGIAGPLFYNRLSELILFLSTNRPASTNIIELARQFELQGASSSTFRPGSSHTAGNIDAFKERNELLHCDRPGGSSLWFPVSNTTDGFILLDTYGSEIDTQLAVYTRRFKNAGAAVPAPTADQLKLVACDRNSGPGRKSFVWFRAAKGIQYLVALDSSSKGCARINIRTNISDFHWVMLDPTTNGTLSLDLNASHARRTLAVFAGTNYNDLHPVAFQESPGNTSISNWTTFRVSGQHTYWVAVEPANGFANELAWHLDLRVTEAEGFHLVEWEGQGFDLVCTRDLDQPWIPITSGIVSQGNRHAYTNATPGGGPWYYRLTPARR